MKYFYGGLSEDSWGTLGWVELAQLHELALRLDAEPCAKLAGWYFTEYLTYCSDHVDKEDLPQVVLVAYSCAENDSTLKEELIEWICAEWRVRDFEEYRESIKAAVRVSASFAADLLRAKTPLLPIV